MIIKTENDITVLQPVLAGDHQTEYRTHPVHRRPSVPTPPNPNRPNQNTPSIIKRSLKLQSAQKIMAFKNILHIDISFNFRLLR